MKQDYRMLIGREFVVGDDIYTICEIVRLENRLLVEAIDSKPSGQPLERVRFAVAEVVQNLLVEEEIELYQPNFFGAPRLRPNLG
jgi:hypothetical protein